MSYKKVVFLFGGLGAEHEVSIATAKAALPTFEDEFELLPVFITKGGMWCVTESYVPAKDAWAVADKLMTQPGTISEVALDEIEATDPYVVFIGLHGEFGEDGTVQALLTARGLAFTGSDAEASALAMDKPRVFELLQNEDVTVPEFLEITATTPQTDIFAFADFRGFPIVVLPADKGSSVGVSIVKNRDDLAEALTLAKHHSERVLITSYIAGRELSCGILAISATTAVPLPPTEIIPNAGHDFFDYDAKYTAGEATEVTPADLPESITKHAQDIAKKVHLLVGADGYSRVDMILGHDSKLYVLEINTLPGMTPTSIIPQQAKAYGLTFGQLLTTICTNVDRSDKDFVTALND